MEATLFEIGLKVATFLGVTVCATVLASGRAPFASRFRAVAMGAVGVTLMIANAWVTSVILAGLFVGAFLTGAGWVFVGMLRAVEPEEAGLPVAMPRLVEFRQLSKNALR